MFKYYTSLYYKDLLLYNKKINFYFNNVKFI